LRRESERHGIFIGCNVISDQRCHNHPPQEICKRPLAAAAAKKHEPGAIREFSLDTLQLFL